MSSHAKDLCAESMLNLYSILPYVASHHHVGRRISRLIHRKPTLVCVSLSHPPLKALILDPSRAFQRKLYSIQRPTTLCEKKYFLLLSSLIHLNFSNFWSFTEYPLVKVRVMILGLALPAWSPEALYNLRSGSWLASA